MRCTQEDVNTLGTPRYYVMNHVCLTVQADQNICLGDIRGIKHTKIICLASERTLLTTDLGFRDLTA